MSIRFLKGLIASRRSVLIACLAVILVPWQAVHAQASENKIVVALATEPPGLDPTMQASASVSDIVWYNIYEGLTRYGPDGKLEPGLAESWSREGDRVYVFNLRPGVVFHDGTPFTSEDVRFSFERNVAEESTNKRKRVFMNFAKIETPDPLTVRITLKEPSSLLPFALAEATAAISSPSTVDNNRTSPVGTGPYKFVEWVRGDSIRLERFEDYNGPIQPTIDEVTFRFLSDENSQILAVRSGQVDYVPSIAAVEAVETIESQGGYRITKGQTQGVLFLGMNNKKAPFDNVNVRAAMYYAVDPDVVNIGTHAGLGKLGGAQTNELNPYFVDVLSERQVDIEKAKELLAEAGYPNGFSVNLRVLSNPSTRRTAEILVGLLAEAGITVELEILETGQWIDTVFRQKNYDMTIISHPEPWAILNYTDPNYFYQYDGPEFRSLIQEAQAAVDEEVIRAKLAAAQKQLYEDAPVVWMYAMPQVGVVREGLNGTRVDLPVSAYPIAEMFWAD